MQCALIAHGLAVIARERHGRDVNPETVLSLALYHDAGEVITGDLPTPVKYKNTEIKGAYKQIEAMNLTQKQTHPSVSSGVPVLAKHASAGAGSWNPRYL